MARLKAYERGCSVPGCEEPHYGLGLCMGHYRRLRRWGTPEGHRPNPTAKPTCSEVGCSRPAVSRGLCRTHYQRMWRAQATTRTGVHDAEGDS